jgi:hypothetical protein
MSNWNSDRRREREQADREEELLRSREKNYDAIKAGVMPATPKLKYTPMSDEMRDRIRASAEQVWKMMREGKLK